MCFGPFKPKVGLSSLAPPPPIEPPARDDPALNVEATAKRKRLLAKKGRKSTILTGSLGDPTYAEIGKKTLLGA